MKNIYGLKSQHPNVELYDLCNILPVKGIYCYQTCRFVKSVLSGMEYNTIAFNALDHDYQTRNATNLYYAVSKNNFGSKRISSVGPFLFNKLTLEIKTCPLHSFNKKLKKWILLSDQLSKLTKFDLLSWTHSLSLFYLLQAHSFNSLF